jgi:hypothetical protein
MNGVILVIVVHVRHDGSKGYTGMGTLLTFGEFHRDEVSSP